jgi:hypothetical protein
MQAEIENEQADTRYEITLTRIEPWKVGSPIVAAAATHAHTRNYNSGV